MASSVTLDVKINQAQLDKVAKTLDRWKGAPLALRAQKAEAAGMKLFVGPLKARAARHNLTGATQRGYAVRKLTAKKYTNEIAAYKVASNTAWRAYAVAGTPYITADPYVDQIRDTLGAQVIGFIDAQVTRLA